jgi:hypothetical protein
MADASHKEGFLASLNNATLRNDIARRSQRC